MSAKKAAPIPKPREHRVSGLLVAVVCDIRGFTGLQARVDELFQTFVLSDENKEKTVRAYARYMTKTQEFAKEIIMSKLTKENKRLKQMGKSTGDGFLIVVELKRGVKRRRLNAKNAKKWSLVVTELAQGAKELVDDAKPRKESRRFGGLTHKFITDHGPKLGLNPEWLKQGTRFRVSAALAMGFGSLVFSGANPKDAYGHPVNMAFRLCDKAGRPSEKNSGDYSPLILIDRRVARLLMQNPAPPGDLFGDWRLFPHHDEVDLKGIEENWCYALKSPEEIQASKKCEA